MHIWWAKRAWFGYFKTIDKEFKQSTGRRSGFLLYWLWSNRHSLHLSHLVAILTSQSPSISRPQTLCARWRCDWSHWWSVLKDAERSLQTKKLYKNGVRSIQGQLSCFSRKWDNKAANGQQLRLVRKISFIDFLQMSENTFTKSMHYDGATVKNGLETGISTQSLPTKLWAIWLLRSPTKNTM